MFRQPHVHTYTADETGDHSHTHFLDTGSEVVAFDAQLTPHLAEEALAWLGRRTSNPVRHVVITHPNPDKFQGIPAFREAGATAIASWRTAGAMRGEREHRRRHFPVTDTATYPSLPPIDETFAGSRALTLDGMTVCLRELDEPGVAGTQTIAMIADEALVAVGDLVHHGVHAWLEGGIVEGRPRPSLDGWAHDLTQLEQLTGADWTVLGGRGDPVRMADAVDEGRAYLRTADACAREVIADLGPAERRAAGRNPERVVSEFRKRMTARYPDYDLPCLLELGSQGLLASYLARQREGSRAA